MKRYRWLKAEWPMSMRALARRLGEKTFDIDQSEGFVIDRVRENYLEARFIEKFEYDDTVTDPFGGEKTYQRTEFRESGFRAMVDGPGLELVDSPRGLQNFVSRLSEVTDFALAISPLSVNVLAWASNVQTRLKVVGVVDSLQVGAIELAPGILAKAIVKGSTDVLSATSVFIRDKKHSAEKLQLRFSDVKKHTLLLSSGGMVKFDHEPSEEILSAVRASLPR